MGNEATMTKDLGALRTSVDQLGAEIKGILDRQDTELKRYGRTTEETGKILDQANARWEAIQAEAKSMQTELSGRLAEMEKRVARAGVLDGAPRQVKTIGQFLVENERFKEAAESKRGQCPPLEFQKSNVFVPGATHWLVNPGQERKSIELTSSELGALVPAWRWDQIIQSPLRPRRVADLIRAIPVTSNKIEYPEEVVTHQLYAELEAQAASGQANVVLERTAEGFYPGQTVVLSKGLAQEESAEVLSVDYDTRTLTMTANLTNTHPLGRSCTAEQFVFTPEAKIKPASRIEFELREAGIKTLATILPVSRQMMLDFPALQSYIDSRLGEFRELSKEDQLLYGNDSTREIQGIMTHPDILQYAWSDGVYGDTKLDAIRRAASLAMLAHLPPDGVTVHTNDWTDIELEKGTDGHYLFFQVQVGGGITQVWRLSLVETTAIHEGHALVGSYQMGAVIWDRQMAEVSVSDQNRDWWEKNIVGIRLEERMSQSVIRPKSFVDCEFDEAPPAP